DPVSRTALPVTMIAARSTAATNVTRRYCAGVRRSLRIAAHRRRGGGRRPDRRPAGGSVHGMGREEYDEFSLFHENAHEYDIPWQGPPAVRREFIDASDGRRVSALVWGGADPELVLVHGGAQNAHTWDTVALALDRPLVALDLPGHGHSDWRGEPRPRPGQHPPGRRGGPSPPAAAPPPR